MRANDRETEPDRPSGRLRPDGPPRRRRVAPQALRTGAVAVAATVCAILLGGCAAGPAGPSAPSVPPRSAGDARAQAERPGSASARAASPAAPKERGAASGRAHRTALAQLATLVVRGRAPLTGYDRDRFGQAWLDADRNGCDTRNDILARDVTDRTVKAGTHGCVVLTGRLADPYTARVIGFARGDDDQVDIDHVVALGDAWVSGAARWDIHRRAALANDPLGLLAVDAHTNRQKGDADAASWLPPARGYRCAYVARQVAVKAKYSLSVTPAEKAAMQRVLTGCPDRPRTADPAHAPTRVDQNIHDPGAPPTADAAQNGRAPQRGLIGRGPVTYANCDAVRAAGRAPIHRGDPGYSSALDRDDDGIGCE